MTTTRRKFLQQSAAFGVASGFSALSTGSAEADSEQKLPMIVDTHQHLWDLTKFQLLWLAGAPEVLRHSFRTKEYLAATEGLNVKAVYMEVDVTLSQHVAEMEHVVGLCASDRHPTVAAVVGGRPASSDFKEYAAQLKRNPAVKGVRQVLHGGGTKAGYCLQTEFIDGVRNLGENGLSFDLCMRPNELQDGVKLISECPDTRFIIDHCGNAAPKAFRPQAEQKQRHDADSWKRSMEALAKNSNVICKISGIVASAPKGWTAEDLAPVVNHCLNVFGPDRVVFGGDWPVCLIGSSLRKWIDALAEIVAARPQDEQNKLWHENAIRWYGLES